MKMIPNEKYQQAISLRRAGLSYSEISKKLGIAKSTLGDWFSKEEWSQSVKETLNQRWGKISQDKILKMNAQRKKLTNQRHLAIQENAREEFNFLIKNPLFIAGLALYWGEGNKTFNGRVSAINAEVGLLQIIVRFYKEILQVDEEKIRAEMFIYGDQEEEVIKQYWSDNLRIAKNQFIKTQVLSSRSNLTKRKVPYGMCSVYFSNTAMSIKIREWFKLFAMYMRE